MKSVATKATWEARDSDRGNDLLSLLEQVDARPVHSRDNAIRELARRGGPLARVAARAGLTDANEVVLNSSVTALGEIGDRSDVARLLPFLKHSGWVTRASAATSLGALGGVVARNALLQALEAEKHPAVRCEVALALAILPRDPMIEMALIAAYSLERARRKKTGEYDMLAKVGLAVALLRLGHTELLNEICGHLRSSEKLVPENTLRALEIVSFEQEQVRRPILECVKEVLSHPRMPGLSEAATELLDRLGTE